MAVETELPRKLRFLMGGKAIQTKLERETYVVTNLPRVMYLNVYLSQDLNIFISTFTALGTVLLLELGSVSLHIVKEASENEFDHLVFL